MFFSKLAFAFMLYLTIKVIENDAKNVNPVLLISFDGLRASYLDEFLKENPSSNFNK